MMKPTQKQTEALAILKTGITRLLLYGGSRSGKTFLICYIIVLAAMKFPGSRHLIARLRFAHAKKTIWKDTLPKAMKALNVPDGSYDKNESDHVITFANGSEIWVDGLDDKERVEKILGAEYNLIFLNEVSQIGYDAVVLVLTRLAMKVEGLRNMAFFDENPPSARHWSHRLFIEKVDPKDAGEKALEDPEEYAYLKMNPDDNRENLPSGYIEKTLDRLPEKARQRFRFGNFTSPEGMVYYSFTQEMVIGDDHPLLRDIDDVEEWTIGTDFGLNMAGVLIAWIGDTLVVYDDYGGYNLTAEAYNEEINDDSKWGKYEAEDFCDPAGGERLQSIKYARKANNSVDPGIDFIQTKMESGQFFIHERCSGVLGEIWDYHRDENGKIVKEDDHYLDAMRYGCFSRAAKREPRAWRV